MEDVFFFLIGAFVSAVLAFLKVAVPFPDLSWGWVILPVVIGLGVWVLPLDLDCG